MSWADVWSVTSYNELYRDGHACERWNMLHPTDTPKVPYVTQCLKDVQGVFVAASDNCKVLADSIDRWMPRRIRALGTERARNFLFFNGLPTAEVSAKAYASIGVARYSSAVHCFAPEIAHRFHRALAEGDTAVMDVLLAGFYLAPRGMGAIATPATDADVDELADAIVAAASAPGATAPAAARA